MKTGIRLDESKRRADNGKANLGRPPYGYRIEHGRFIVDDKQATIIRLIFDMLDAGVTLHEIADSLNKAEVPSPEGKRWKHPAILRMRARRPFYEGKCVIIDGKAYVPAVPVTHWPILQTKDTL